MVEFSPASGEAAAPAVRMAASSMFAPNPLPQLWLDESELLGLSNVSTA
jgi:hypothetical protein